MEPAVKDATFVRQPDRKLRERAYLAQFTGDYEVFGLPLSISLRSDARQGDALWMTFGGEPAQVLEPYQGTEFQVKNQSGFSIEFKKDVAGNVVEAILVQPGAVFTVKKVSR
jgi:hypothetical protein